MNPRLLPIVRCGRMGCLSWYFLAWAAYSEISSTLFESGLNHYLNSWFPLQQRQRAWKFFFKFWDQLKSRTFVSIIVPPRHYFNTSAHLLRQISVRHLLPDSSLEKITKWVLGFFLSERGTILLFIFLLCKSQRFNGVRLAAFFSSRARNRKPCGNLPMYKFCPFIPYLIVTSWLSTL